MTRDNKRQYKKDLERAYAKLGHLESERERLDELIGEARRMVIHLNALVYGDEAREAVQYIGLSATCELALKMAGSPMDVPRIKRLIADLGYDIDAHKNPLASIHTTIARLVESGKVRAINVRNESTTYEWVRQNKVPHKVKGKFKSRFEG